MFKYSTDNLRFGRSTWRLVGNSLRVLLLKNIIFIFLYRMNHSRINFDIAG